MGRLGRVLWQYSRLQQEAFRRLDKQVGTVLHQHGVQTIARLGSRDAEIMKRCG